MLRITIICVGKKHDAMLADAIYFYENRVAPYCTLAWDIIPSSNEEDEGRRIVDRVGSNYLLLLDEHGKEYNTEGMSALFEGFQNTAKTNISIVIGGAHGVSPAVKERANTVFSLSRLTFPHQLVRLIIIEQLYRSLSLLAGSKYHHR